MGILRFEEMEAWLLTRQLTLAVYTVTANGPFAEDWALRDQIRSASGSVMHTIAEGFDAGTHPEFTRFLAYAQQSCTEMQSELYVAHDHGYISEEEVLVLLQQVTMIRTKIGAFIKYLKSTKHQALSTTH